MKQVNDFALLGHLQVLDEPLSSVYTENKSGMMYLFVRIFEDTDVDTYILSEVTPRVIIDYMDGKIGLTTIFKNNHAYYYQHVNKVLSRSDFKPLSGDSISAKLANDGLADTFDNQLAYRSVPLKQYLRNIV